MKTRRLVLMVILGLTIISTLPTNITQGESTTPAFDYDDVLIPLDIPENASSGSPPGYYETSEYLIGDAAVGIIFLESNGSIDPSTEDWTSTEESNVINEITDGLNWLASQNPDANVSFTSDIHYRVPTNYEPINHRSYPEEHLWISEAMTFLGYPGTSKWIQVRDYINDLRNTFGTDWAYAMFIVDSSNDPDGEFTDGYCAYAWLGGPFLVMTYDNDGYGIGNMDYVAAHETCHMFYATDEYNGVTETSGYLGVQDLEGSGCMMETALSWWLCTSSREQLGWRDSDVDGIQDIVDTFPDATLNPYSPDPTFDTNLIYTGSAVEIPYPNNNSYGTGRDVTINTITNMQFRVDSGTWTDATPSDGAFDEDEENFTFTTPPLSVGTHTIEVRGINSVGNIEISYANDTVTVRSILKNWSFERVTTSVYDSSGWWTNAGGHRALKGDIWSPEGVPDGLVDIDDVMAVSLAFGAYPGHPNWNTETNPEGPDLTGDAVVDIDDVIIPTLDFGKYMGRDAYCIDGTYSWYTSGGGQYLMYQQLDSDAIQVIAGKTVTFSFWFYPESVASDGSQNNALAKISYLYSGGGDTVYGVCVCPTELKWWNAYVTATLPSTTNFVAVTIYGKPDFKAWVDLAQLCVIE